MNKKLVLAAALVFGVAGLILALGTVKAQDNADNSAMAADNTATADNTMNADNADNAAVPADNATANAAQ